MKPATIYISKYTGTIYGETSGGNIDTGKTFSKKDVNLREYYQVAEGQTYTQYSLIQSTQEEAHTQAPAAWPILTGTEALNFHKYLLGLSKRDVSYLGHEQNKRAGYYRTVKEWVTFDNREGELRFETHQEEALCIEWLKD